MRAGGCTVQQALAAEAASIVKQAVTLARRRGHAQVTPLHVANTMLASHTGLLRTACLQSHSHPLQCKALELCFNVALNRLPTSSSSPMLTPHSHHPSLSNALLAAFKRAQAHQRRGSIENQQQPLLAVKIELEQLIISILDDPSVSRVMREAGFSSTQVKGNVEKAVSSEKSVSNPSINKPNEGNLLVLGGTISPSPYCLGQLGVKVSEAKPLDQFRSEDVMSVVDNLVSRRRSILIVGECLASSEGVVKGVMEKVDKREVPEALRNVQFINIPPFSFGHLSKSEVEQKLGEIRYLVKGCPQRGIILYLGDLKWVAEYRANSGSQGRNYCCPVEHMIMELGRIVFGTGENRRLWLLGIATYQTYMRCRIGHPSLETVWGLHPLTIPANSLGLSLTPDSDPKCQLQSNKARDELGRSFFQDGLEKQLTCCSDCASKFESEALSLADCASHHNSTSTISSSLPSWLQQCKEESKRLTSNEQGSYVKELCKKWNSICNSFHKLHHPPDKSLTSFHTSISSSSFSTYDQRSSRLHHQARRTLDAKQPVREHQFWISDAVNEAPQPNLRTYIPEHRETTLALFANPSPNPNSASSSDTMEMECLHSYKELNAENLKTLCKSLEEKVPCQKEIIPQIASTILQCRSGMVRRKGNLALNETKEDTWLLFLGDDTEAKEKIARELAFLIFGSHASFTSIGMSSFSNSSRSETSDDFRNKRSRAESSCSYLERFADAIGSSQHSIFFLEDIEQIDYYYHLGIKSAIERGRIRNSNGDEVCFCDAIIILSCESLDARSRASSRASSPPIKQKLETEEEEEVERDEEISPCVSLDLNLSFDDLDDLSFDDTGLLGSVDGKFIFRSSDVY